MKLQKFVIIYKNDSAVKIYTSKTKNSISASRQVSDLICTSIILKSELLNKWK